MINKHKTNNVVSYFAIYLALIIVLFPILWLLMLSFKNEIQAFSDPPLFIFKPTLENWKAIFYESDFMKSFFTSLIIASGSTVFSMLFGVTAAYGLTRIKGRIKKVILLLVALMRTAPAMTYVIPYFLFLMFTNMLDTKVGLMMAYQALNIPMVIWLMISFFQSIPYSLEEAAEIDSATRFQIFTKINLPLVTQGLISTAILIFIMNFNEYILAMTLTRREALTAPIAITTFMAYEGTEWGKVAVSGIILLLPVVGFYFLTNKYLVSGLSAGSVKG